jgi:hypothetical protein
LTKRTVSIMKAYSAERVTLPGHVLFCGPRGQGLSRDALTYLGPDAVFPGQDAPAGYIFHITPEKVVGEGTWSS